MGDLIAGRKNYHQAVLVPGQRLFLDRDVPNEVSAMIVKHAGDGSDVQHDSFCRQRNNQVPNYVDHPLKAMSIVSSTFRAIVLGQEKLMDSAVFYSTLPTNALLWRTDDPRNLVLMRKADQLFYGSTLAVEVACEIRAVIRWTAY
jgi:hypothetical protein